MDKQILYCIADNSNERYVATVSETPELAKHVFVLLKFSLSSNMDNIPSFDDLAKEGYKVEVLVVESGGYQIDDENQIVY